MPQAAPIAIIGAGIAGIACARQLQLAGHSVLVLEKSRGIGGRMSTRRRDTSTWDHGAQFFTARSPAFITEVKQWQAAGVVVPWQGKIVTIQPDHIAPTPADTRWVGTPGMPAAVRHMARGLHVLTSHTVTRLQRRGAQWEITTREFGTLPEPFAAVVLALPAPQATALLATAAPAMLAAYAGVVMHPCWAVMLSLPQEGPAPPFDAATVHGNGPLAWVAANHSKPGRPQTPKWVLHATPGFSAAHLEDPPEAVAAALIAAFIGLGGSQPTEWQALRPGKPGRLT